MAISKDLFKKAMMNVVEELGLEPVEISYVKNSVTCRGIIGKDKNEADRLQSVTVINIDALYADYSSGKISLSAALEEGKKIMERKHDIAPTMDALKDWSTAKEKLFLSVCKAEGNETYLNNMVYKTFEDIAIVPRFFAAKSSNGLESATVPLGYLTSVGISEDELFTAALENSAKMFPARLCEVTPKIGIDYVITNEVQLYGAAAMFYDGFLPKVKEIIGEDFYILPSSIHELFIVPASRTKMTALAMKSMVTDINNDRVAIKEEDVLSNSVYFFDGELKKIA